jgi:hypothetical protein
MLNNKQFKWQDELIHHVGLLFFKKDWVIKEICYHPLKFAKRRMEDPKDKRPIRIRYFAAFVPKEVKSKERINKFKQVFRDYPRYGPILKELGYDVDTKEKFEAEMHHIGNKGIYKIDEIFKLGLANAKKGSVVNEE